MGKWKNLYSDEEYENEGPICEPGPGDWCMDCGLFPGLDGRCSECGRDTADFKDVKNYCTINGKRFPEKHEEQDGGS